MAGALHQLQLIDEAIVFITQMRAGFVGVELLDDFHIGTLVTVTGGVHNDVVIGEVINALEVAVATDRPGDRRRLDLQDRFDFVEQFDRVADVTVEFVDEADNRRVTQTADVHQRDGPWLYTLTTVKNHQRRVDRRQGAVGVFGEVFVTRGVEQVDHVIAIRELHDRRGNRDTTLLFHFHPVGGGMAVGLARLHRAGNRNRLAHQQELLGDGGLTGIGVGNNGESAAFRDFGGLFGHGKSPGGDSKKGGEYSANRPWQTTARPATRIFVGACCGIARGRARALRVAICC